MECDVCREAISAQLDGEGPVAEVPALDLHLAGCASCFDWQLSARMINRTMRLQPALDVPDLVEQILASAPAQRPISRYRARLGVGWRRLALATVAVGQIALGGVQILGGDVLSAHTHGMAMAGMSSMSSHLTNETSTWNLAIGLGMLFAAIWPRAALGMLPVLGPFVVVITMLSAKDLAAGEVTVSRLATHGLLLVGLGLLILVDKAARTYPGPLYSAKVTSPDKHRLSDARFESESPVAGPSGRTHRHLRPASRRAA